MEQRGKYSGLWAKRKTWTPALEGDEKIARTDSWQAARKAEGTGRASYICDCALDGRLDEIDQLLNDVVAVTFRGKLIKCKTVGQKKYVDAIKEKHGRLSA